MRRSHVVSVAGALALCLVAASPQRLIGDGREYLAQAINFASFHGPGLRPRDIDAVQAEMARFDPALAAWDVRGASAPDWRRSRDFAHFWFYALLAAPGVWVTRALNLPPTLAFTALNLLLFFTALWMALPRAGAAACLLLFASPVVWWIDKAHTEVFTFALLAVAFALCEERPWWSMAAAGAAATQNPPIGVLIPLVWIAAVLRDRMALTDRRIISGALVGLSFSLLHPLYTYVHHHTPSLLLTATRSDAPTAARLVAVVLDPDIGLLGNFPVFLVVVGAAAATAARRVPRERHPEMTFGIGVSTIAAAVFLFAFSRTTNVHHGGTPSLSRYAIWLIPLAIPLLARARQDTPRSWRLFLWSCAVISAVISIVAFRPSVPQNSREPTLLATLLWTRLPSLNNPLPEVFSETLLHTDDVFVPVATPGCEKVLTGGAPAGVSPIPCYPVQLSVVCAQPGALCYANRENGSYDFTKAAADTAGMLRSDAVWPAGTEAHVRRLYDAWGWRTFDFADDRPRDIVVRAVGVAPLWVGSTDRFILILRNTRTGAMIRLRPSRSMHGVLVDAGNGATVAALTCGEANAICDVELPETPGILLLAMR